MNLLNKFNGEYSNDPGFRIARIVFVILIIVFLTVVIWHGRDTVRIPEPRTMVVYCFSGMQEVMERGIFPAFQDYWHKKSGNKLEFVSTFAGSGTIIHKIISRFPAEVAILSSWIDAIRLSERSFVYIKNLEEFPYHGVINRTPTIMIVRENNPKQIADFSDLRNPGVKIVHPDPLTSGAGQWAILAFYGSVLRQSNDKMEALGQLKRIWKNVTYQPASARNALQQFISGKGDVLITYESNISGKLKGKQIQGQLIYPHSTVVSEPIVVTIEKNIELKQRDLVDAFVQYLWSKEAQQIFVRHGFQSIDEALNLTGTEFTNIHDPFTLDSLGGPREAMINIIDELWQNQILPDISQ